MRHIKLVVQAVEHGAKCKQLSMCKTWMGVSYHSALNSSISRRVCLAMLWQGMGKKSNEHIVSCVHLQVVQTLSQFSQQMGGQTLGLWSSLCRTGPAYLSCSRQLGTLKACLQNSGGLCPSL